MVKRYFFELVDFASARVDKYGARYISFGAFSLINYILPFYMWSEHHSADPLVLCIRVIAGILNFFLLMHESWYQSLKRYLPLFWYFTVMYSLPFFASYMLFLEGFSVFWIINVSLALVLSLIVLDFYSFLVIFPLGVVCAFLVAWLGGAEINTQIGDDISFQAVYLMIFSGIISIVFSRNREKIEQERIGALRAFGATIAHEMRTPLSTVSMLCKLTGRELEKAPDISKKIVSNVGKIANEVSEMLLTVDMILTKLDKQPTLYDDMEQLSMKECVLEALDRYPFCNGEKELVTFIEDNNFELIGNKNSIVHILFNLIQNAIYQIRSAGKGTIRIKMMNYRMYNVLSFKDTASGIDAAMYNKLFTPMVSSKFSGTGLGLYFCKNAMEAMDGVIYCDTVLEKYAEFFLAFPNTKASKMDKLKAFINIQGR